VINTKVLSSVILFVLVGYTSSVIAQGAAGDRTFSGQIVKATAEVKSVPSRRASNAVILTPKQAQERQAVSRHQQSAVAASSQY
jgi:hypothetical protein